MSGYLLFKAVSQSKSANQLTVATPSGITENKSVPEPQSVIGTVISGTYRCWSFNIAGVSAGSCRNPPQAPLVFDANGTYKVSSEEGTYQVEGNVVYLSAAKFRNRGEILADGNQIRFEYDLNSKHYTITYLKQAE